MNTTNDSVAVRVPASSANIGPGFDVLGMALSLHLEAGFGTSPADSIEASQNHPTLVAFRHSGGTGPLWVRSQMPMGKGLGFSGAARIAGVSLAHAQKNGTDETVFQNAHREILAIATELEGHPDNVAASLLGGVVASVAGSTVRIPTLLDPSIIVWVPQQQTSTKESRTKLPANVPFADAVFNIGRTALLVAALAANDISALQIATQDRLHQDVRLKKVPESQEALNSFSRAGAWCAWLSGSGPTVAAMCDGTDAQRIADALPDHGSTMVLRIAEHGAQLLAI
ncbi:homoserine kinase [Acidimicrobiaceae bacterium]|nr:homoserine kinase [Acidimicrobiaceae bacterium]